MVRTVFLEKWEFALERESIQDHSKRKYINFGIALLFHMKLGSHIKGRTFGRHVCKDFNIFYRLRKPEISNFEVSIFYEDILWLHISMNDILLVESSVALCYLF